MAIAVALDGSVDQSIFMVEEKEVASARCPDAPSMACSSEAAACWAFLGFTPTQGLGAVSFGAPGRGARSS